MIGRPYHNDPGQNHAVLEEFQALGYPILSMRSIPKDREFLDEFFAEDLKQGRDRDPLDVSDVWPENYSVELGAEGVGGEVRDAAPERRGARPARPSSAVTTRRPTA